MLDRSGGETGYDSRTSRRNDQASRTPQGKIEIAHDRQKSYADKHRKKLEFAVGDEVYLK